MATMAITACFMIEAKPLVFFVWNEAMLIPLLTNVLLLKEAFFCSLSVSISSIELAVSSTCPITFQVVLPREPSFINENKPELKGYTHIVFHLHNNNARLISCTKLGMYFPSKNLWPEFRITGENMMRSLYLVKVSCIVILDSRGTTNSISNYLVVRFRVAHHIMTNMT